MYSGNGQAERARWAVMWVYITSSGKRKVARKNFGADLAGARDLYAKAKAANKPAATLACVNMGFPPPQNLQIRTVKKRGRVRGTRKIKTVTVEINPLRDLNLQGKLYCPYCMAIRPFIRSKGATVGGVWVSDVRYICPICGISHRDHWVRAYNPAATLHMESSLASRRVRTSPTNGSKRRRRRRR